MKPTYKTCMQANEKVMVRQAHHHSVFRKKLLILLCLAFLTSFYSFGQIRTSYRAETFGSAASGDHTPFWMMNHRWGMTTLDAGNWYVRGGVFHEQTLNRDWSWDAGIDLAGGSDAPYGKAWLQQLYGRLNWKIWRLNIGSREDYVSFLHQDLSSGDFIHSNHARPRPQVRISLSEFLLIPHTKGILSIKGDFSAGKYLDGQWQEDRAIPNKKSYSKDVLSHDKSLYFRFGDIGTRHKMQFTFGLNQSTQWGGILYRAGRNAQYTIEKQPRGTGDFIRVLIAKEGSASASGADQVYVAGNQKGAYTLKYDYRLKNENQLSAYIHHYFDDGSGLAWENYPDNLIGLEFRSLKKCLLSGVVFEYIYTKQQTGPIHFNTSMDDEHRDKLIHKENGNDNYYNHVDYPQGHSYFGKSMGTPLFLPPEYNTNGSMNFTGSRIIAFHAGLEGFFLPVFQYRLLLTSGQNWGRYYHPYKEIKKGFASQLELIYTSPKAALDIQLSVGYNHGSFFGGDDFGAGLTFIKRGVIYSK